LTYSIIEADCVEAMQAMDEASVDAIVTDPPYMLGFMGKDWDKAKPGDIQHGHDRWATEALRVLKPGGHLLAFGGTRTYHRLACAIEDAGFEIRDSVIWLYGSGFPKSLDVSKAIDKAADCPECEGEGYVPRGSGQAMCQVCAGTGRATREVVSEKLKRHQRNQSGIVGTLIDEPRFDRVTTPATPEAQQWQGWGTALKPAHEPIVVARKPLIGTVAQNVLEHGTGAINVDGCRIGLGDDENCDKLEARSGGERGFRPDGYVAGKQDGGLPPGWDASKGRWPANVALSHLPECERVGTRRVKGNGRFPGVQNEEPGAGRTMGSGWTGEVAPERDLDDEQVEAWRCAEGCPVAELDRQSGELPGRPNRYGATDERSNAGGYGGGWNKSGPNYGDTGGASRFYHITQSPGDHLPECERIEIEQGCAPGCPVAELDRQSGELTSGSGQRRPRADHGTQGITFADDAYVRPADEHARDGDTGGASRFFATFNGPQERPIDEGLRSSPPSRPGDARFLYQAKASRAERNAGLDGFEEREQPSTWGDVGPMDGNPRKVDTGHVQRMRNVHPTVKPIDLMRWLVRLVTPPGGTVLDPFTGSGTTGIAATLEGFDFIGIEREAEYAEIAEARVKHWQKVPQGTETKAALKAEAKERKRKAKEAQDGLF
jgi:DNA modification methylase